MLKENGDFLSDYARILAKANRDNDSNDILRMGTLISNNPMFLILQGNNYLEMEAYEDAEQLYLKAWHTMPNRIYPLYKLMKLHERLGNSDKTLPYAEQIVRFKGKVESLAIREIKSEANAVLSNNKDKIN